jgi:alpha-mannosidase
MIKINLTTLLVTLLALVDIGQSYGQDDRSSRVEFLNAPVLYKEGNKSFQQVVASYSSQNTGKIVFTKDGKELLRADIEKWDNRFLLTFPAVTKPTKIIISAKIDDRPAEKYPVTLVPPKKWGVDFVQHSHTDVGYTRPQSEILAEHLRFIDYALDYCDQTDHFPDDARFRWSCESSWVVREYLRSRPATQIERFKKRVAEGRIEVTALYLNMAEITDENVMYDFVQPLKDFSKLGIPVKMAMQNDINGVAWCLPDYFKNTGVKYLSMGSNYTRAALPFDLPTCFWWESPSGARLLGFRADIYMTPNDYGLINGSPKFAANILWHLANLDKNNFPFDRIALEFCGYRTDNAPPSTAACEAVQRWNARYEYPKFRLATISEFFEYVEKNYANTLPVYRNAWLDWWTDGCGTSSRETAEVRKAQNIKQVDDGLFAMVSMMGGQLDPSLESKMEHISENTLLFDEHTFGASESINEPFAENSIKQWMQKASYSWEALKKVTLLNEEGLARFQPFLNKPGFPVIYVINPMGWTRSGDINLFVDYEVLPVKTKARIIDLSTGKEVPAQVMTKRAEGAYWVIEVSDVPALGYKALKIELSDQGITSGISSNVEVLENKFYKITIDKATGSIGSLFDKELNQEFVDSQNPYHFGQPVRETSAERDVAPFVHTTVSNVKIEKGINGAIWESAKITSDLNGCEMGTAGSPKGIEMEIRLYKNVKKIELRYMARKLIITDPEAVYMAFPISLPGSRIVFETIGGILSQGQQLPGSSSDWNAAQNFVAVRGKNGQIVVVSNEVPLWQFSDFNMGKFDRNPKPGKTWLYSWVMNNYWTTNFRAYQEGGFSWTYQITSSADTTNSFATKYAWGERNPFPTRAFPAGADELKSPSLETLHITGPANAMLVNTRPVFNGNGSVLLHFRELEGLPAEVQLSSAVPGRPIKKMVVVNAIGGQIGQPVKSIQLSPYEVKFIKIEF